jgi:hypothetical protein
MALRCRYRAILVFDSAFVLFLLVGLWLESALHQIFVLLLGFYKSLFLPLQLLRKVVVQRSILQSHTFVHLTVLNVRRQAPVDLGLEGASIELFFFHLRLLLL